MVAVSVLLAIGMMIPSAGLGMVSCTRCSVPIYD
jgi:Na+-transporting NADH:ubiquinone oxidoreductase subunit NqrF